MSEDRGGESGARWRVTSLDVIMGLVGFVIFEALFLQRMTVDLLDHIKFLEAFIRGEMPLPGNSLYYLLVWAGSGFSSKQGVLLTSAMGVLAASMMVKFMGSRIYVMGVSPPGARTWRDVWALGTVCALMCAFSIPASHYYLGSFPITTWHNSTMIACMPTVVGAFMLALSQFERPTWKKHLGMGVLVAVSVWFKPSFFFIFVVAYPVMMCLFHRLSRATLWACVSMIPGILMVAQVYASVYMASKGAPAVERGVELAPFVVWDAFTTDRGLSLARSMVFPVVVLVLGGRQVFKDRGVQLGALLCVGALLCFVLFAEKGPRRFHGNFVWQCYMCNFVLFLACLKCMIRRLYEHAIDWRLVLMHVAYGAHVIGGLMYLKAVLMGLEPII